ncbi:hypothetical protein OIU78_028681 [Salix suchowensis]|nr:hypothetical protein OIU78_028681 [Salix suchowensis]
MCTWPLIRCLGANSLLEDQGQVFTSPSATYVGVYDGHGGPEASRFLTSHLFPFLHKFAAEQGGLSADAIRKAIGAAEMEFLHFVKQSWIARPQMASVGSCCLVGAISNDVLYVANLGDSRVVLGRKVSEGKENSAVVAERLTTDHNVSVEEVRKEVEALHPDDAHIVVCTRGVWRIKGIIQVLLLHSGCRNSLDFHLSNRNWPSMSGVCVNWFGWTQTETKGFNESLLNSLFCWYLILHLYKIPLNADV